MERPLRLIAANPVDALARTLEALLVVASQPLTVDELAEATADDAERVETALGLLSERFREGRSGIVLEQVAGGWAFRASREAAEACGRLFERPVERNLSQAALETLAVIAYMGPCSRPEIARLRGVAVDSVVAGLAERGLIAEAGREPLGAVRYRVTPLFERVFGLESLAALPRLEDLGGDAEELRGRLEVLGRAPSRLARTAALRSFSARSRAENIGPSERTIGANRSTRSCRPRRRRRPTRSRLCGNRSRARTMCRRGRGDSPSTRPCAGASAPRPRASRSRASTGACRSAGGRRSGTRPPRGGAVRQAPPRPTLGSVARAAPPSPRRLAPRSSCRGR